LPPKSAAEHVDRIRGPLRTYAGSSGMGYPANGRVRLGRLRGWKAPAIAAEAGE
jgi:hypothetical protein